MAANPEQLTSGFSGDPWSQQPGESARAFLAFTHYRDLGMERSQAKADENYRAEVGLTPKPAKELPTKQISEWSRIFRWVERCAAYDDHLDAIQLAIHRKQRIRSATLQANRAAKAAAALSHPMELYVRRMEEVAGGRRLDQLNDLGDEDLLRLARHAISLLPEMHKAERDALNSTTDAAPQMERVKLRGEVLRRVLGSSELFGALEQVAFELTADVDRPTIEVENVAEPVTEVTGDSGQKEIPPED